MTSQPALTYLSFDSAVSGIGASQVMPYVLGLVRRGLPVMLHSWEPDPGVTRTEPGLRWTAHPFGRHGPFGGAQRVLQGARAVRPASLVHARADLAAASALLARARPFVWDMRSFWADERLEQGQIGPRSSTLRILRRIERAAALESAAIVTLTERAREVLRQRHGTAVAEKVHVITTCADLDRFALRPAPDNDTCISLLHIGSMNRQYDGSLLARFAVALRSRARTDVRLTVSSASPTAWEDVLASLARELAVVRTSGPHSDMPELISAHHAGVAVCRLGGTSLQAAMPTKVAEYLAVGRPVVVTRGTGDLEHLVHRHNVGAVITDDSDDAIHRAATELLEVLTDPELPQRCRALAESMFGLDDGIDRLMEIYRRAAE